MSNLTAALAGRVLCLLILLTLLGMLGWTAPFRKFDPDEFQHVQMAWLIAHGQVPYRDFFEHHTPLYHFAIAPLLLDARLASDGAAAVSSLMTLRWIGVVLCAVIIAQTYFLARQIADPLAAMCAAVLIAACDIFTFKGLEIRPDQLAACLMLGATIALVLSDQSRRPVLQFMLAGAAAMLAILTTQKILFALPGLAVTFLAVMLRRKTTVERILRDAAAVVAGALASAMPLLMWFAHHNALSIFFTDNFFLGTSWPRDEMPLLRTGTRLLRDDMLFVLFVGLGGMALLGRGWRAALWPTAIIAPMISMVVLMPLFPVVQAQYFFLWLPLAAVLGGFGAAFVIERLGTTHVMRVAVATLIAGAVALHGGLTIKEQSRPNPYETSAFDTLRYVVTQTSPQSTVLRAWSTGTAFRRPAFFYFSLHSEIRSVVPQGEWRALEAGLRSGSIAPELVEMDDAMRALPSGIVSALEDGWEPTGTGSLWRRKSR